MKNIRIAAIFLIALSALPLFAQTDAEKLLNAPRVEDALVFQVHGTTVTARVDGRSTMTITNGTTFTAPFHVDFVYPNYNPFKTGISLTEEAKDDPTAQAVADFVKALTGMANVVLPKPPQPAAAQPAWHATASTFNPAVIDCAAERATCLASIATLTGNQKTLATEACEERAQRCAECVKQRTKFAEALASREKYELPQSTLNEWVNDAHGKAGVTRVRDSIEKKRTDLATRIKEAKSTLADISEAARKTGQTCAGGDLNATQLALYLREADASITAATKLHDSLKTLEDMLGGFAAARWRGTAEEDYVFGTAQTSPLAIKQQTVTFVTREAKVSDSGTSISLTDGDKETRVFNIRRHRRLVPEVGIGLVYNELEYPTYTAVDPEEDGSFIIERTTEAGKLEGALFMNLLCNCLGDDTIYPGVQIGVSTAEDYPGILLGLAARFGGLQNLAIGIGGMTTWYKDLTDLSEGSAVENQKAIDDDLRRRRSPFELYFAVQYTF